MPGFCWRDIEQNLKLLDEATFVEFRTVRHEKKAMLEEIVRRAKSKVEYDNDL